MVLQVHRVLQERRVQVELAEVQERRVQVVVRVHQVRVEVQEHQVFHHNIQGHQQQLLICLH